MTDGERLGGIKAGKGIKSRKGARWEGWGGARWEGFRGLNGREGGTSLEGWEDGAVIFVRGGLMSIFKVCQEGLGRVGFDIFPSLRFPE